MADTAVAVPYPEMADPSKSRTLDAANDGGDRYARVNIPNSPSDSPAGDIDARRSWGKDEETRRAAAAANSPAVRRRRSEETSG